MRTGRLFIDCPGLHSSFWVQNEKWTCGRCILVMALLWLAIPMATVKLYASPLLVTVSDDVKRLDTKERTDIRFRRLDLSQGLSQTRVSQIIQDDDGYMWFGTQHGVSRYDGYSYRVYKHDRQDPDSLSGVFIYALFKDRSGTVWVGSDQYLDAYDKLTGKFRHYQIAPTNPTVIHISQDEVGFLWLSTSQGLFRFDGRNGAVKRFAHEPGDDDSLSSSDIKSSGMDRSGDFWVATGAGLEQFDRNTGHVSIRIPLREEVREFYFHEDSHGLFWIIYGSGNGLALYDRRSNKVIRYTYSDQGADAGLSGVYSILETTSGDIWLATMGSGLLRFDREHFSFDGYRNDPNDDQSLAENRAIALFEDREGNVWTGLHARPPNMFPGQSQPFRKVWPHTGHIDALGENLVNVVFKDHLGAIWLGAGGSLYRIQGESLSTYSPAGQGVPVEVLSITEGSDGRLWIGTLGSGLYVYDPATEAFRSFRYVKGKSDGLSSDIITRIYIAPSGEMWLTTWNGLDQFDPKTGSVKTFKRNPDSSAEPYFSIIPGEDRALWLGTTAGLVRFLPDTKQFTVYAHDPGDNSSLSNNTVNSIIEQGDDTIWVGTQNGLNRFSKQSGRFDALSTDDGLSGNAVSCLLIDPSGILWMSTNRGISRLDTRTMAFKTYSTVDGLPGDDLTGWNACATRGDGELLFGGFSGAVASTKEANDSLPIAPSVVITDLRAADTPVVVPTSSAAPFKVTLPYWANRLSLTFAALSFRDPATTRYRYRLNGLDGGWQNATASQRSLSYASLPSGRFMLEMQAASRRGDWGEPGTFLSIEVTPPWWRTWWFYAACAALLLASIALAFRIRVAQLASRYNIRLEERVNERSRLARDLHDTLLQSFQGIIFRIQAARHMLPGRPTEAAAALDVVLEKSDEAILEARSAVQTLRDWTDVGRDLAEAVTLLGQELSALVANPPQFEVVVTGRPAKLDPRVRDDVHRIAFEAIRNAFKHSGATKITCRLYYLKSEFRLIVADDGEGIKADVPRSSGRWGMTGMSERAERIGANLIIECLSGQGTRIELLLKLGRKPRVL